VIGTDCIGSCKANYHTITTTATPKNLLLMRKCLLLLVVHLFGCICILG